MEKSLPEYGEASIPMLLSSARTQIRSALHATHGLTLLNTVLEDPPAHAMLHLLRLLVAEAVEPAALAEAYSHTLRVLATLVYDESALQLPQIPDAWQAYLIARLLDTTNLWNSYVERNSMPTITLRKQAQRDLRALHSLFQLDAALIQQLTQIIVAPALPELADAWIAWSDLADNRQAESSHARAVLAQQIALCADWTELVQPLERYWKQHGSGPLAHYRALRWQGIQQQLAGITYPDPVQLSNLIGQQRQQARLSANVERFLAGLPVHDMLLYGTPGTGKSSTIKALVNAYADQGLRLVEIRKEDLSDLPQVIAYLRNRALRYLLFIDDLSFEEHETSYKALKVLLEGTAEARPANVLICATTNRINLVRENFADRGKPNDDVNWRDTMDEKQALSHRFGLRVTFFSPDQQQYLQIIDELASQRQLDLPMEILHTRAIQWEHQHAARSGRVARQFIDDLEAELKYTEQTESSSVT